MGTGRPGWSAYCIHGSPPAPPPLPSAANSLGAHGAQQLVAALQQRTVRLQRLGLEGNVKVPAHLARAAINLCTPAVSAPPGFQELTVV